MATSLVHLLQLCSQTLPVGAYAYSQAQESAIAGDLVNDQESAEEWIEGVFRYGFGQLDLPALVLAHDAAGHKDWRKLEELDEYLQASRESRELLLEDLEMGRALKRLLAVLGVENGISETPSFVTQFACVGAGWGITLQDLLVGLSYSWLENQVMVATKSVPLGQSQAALAAGHVSCRHARGSVDQHGNVRRPVAVAAPVRLHRRENHQQQQEQL